MAAHMRDWIKSTVVKQLTNILNKLQSDGDSKADSTTFKKRMVEPKGVQLIQNNGSRHVISDGTTYVETEFELNGIKEYEEKSSRKFSELEGGIIFIRDYDIPSVHFFVREFKLSGSEGSAPFGSPLDVSQNSEVRNVFQRLEDALQKNEDGASSLSQSPIQSQEIPYAPQHQVSSAASSESMSQIATQVYDYGVRKVVQAGRAQDHLLAAFLPTKDSRTPPINRSSRVVLKQVSKTVVEETMEVLKTRDSQQSQSSTVLDSPLTPEPNVRKGLEVLSSGDAVALSRGEDEEGNSRVDVDEAQTDAPKREPITAVRESVKTSIKLWAPDFTRKTLGRKGMNVPAELLSLENEAWNRERKDSNVLREHREKYIEFLEHKSHPGQDIMDAHRHESPDDGIEDDEEDADEEDDQGVIYVPEQSSTTTGFKDDVLSEADLRDSEHQLSDRDSEEQYPERKSSPKVALSQPPSMLANVRRKYSSPEQSVSPSPPSTHNSHKCKSMDAKRSRHNSSPSLQNQKIKSFRENTPPRFLRFEKPASLSQEDEVEDELEISILHAVGDVLENDVEQSELPETSQELPCTAPTNRKHVLVKQTPNPALTSTKQAKGTSGKGAISPQHMPSDLVIPATFDNSEVDSPLPSSGLIQVASEEQSSPTRSIPEQLVPRKAIDTENTIQKNESSAPPVSEISEPMFIVDDTPPVSPAIQIPATDRKPKAITPLRSPTQFHSSKRTSDTACSNDPSSKRLKRTDNDGPRAKQIAQDNKHSFLSKIRATAQGVLKPPLSDMEGEVSPPGSAGYGRARVSSTYADENLERFGNRSESSLIQSQPIPNKGEGVFDGENNRRAPHSDSSPVCARLSLSKAIFEAVTDRVIPFPKEYIATDIATGTEERSLVSSRTGSEELGNKTPVEEEIKDTLSSEEPQDSGPHAASIMEKRVASPGVGCASSTQLIFYNKFKASYPDYEGSKAEFTRALVYLEWLHKECKAIPKYCDDFIRFLADDYTKLVAEYKRQMKNYKAQMNGNIKPEKCLTGYEFYQRHPLQPRYKYNIIDPQNIQAALCTLDTHLVEQTRSRYWPDDDNFRVVPSVMIDGHSSFSPIDTNHSVASDNSCSTSANERKITSEVSLKPTYDGVVPRRRFFETASQQVVDLEIHKSAPVNNGSSAITGFKSAKSTAQKTLSHRHASITPSSRDFNKLDNGSYLKSKSRKSLPWLDRASNLATPGRSAIEDDVTSASSTRYGRKGSHIEDGSGSPILGSLRQPSEDHDLKRKRKESSSAAQLQPFESIQQSSKAARRVTMPAMDVSDRPVQDLKRQKMSRSSMLHLDGQITTASKSSRTARRQTMPAGDIHRLGRAKDGRDRTPLKMTERSWKNQVNQLKMMGYIPPSLKNNAKNSPAEPCTQAWDA